MEMKSTTPYPPPPPYSSTIPCPEPQPSSYGYPAHPATTWTSNHPAAPPTTEIGFGEVHTMEPNQEPSPMVVVYKYKHTNPKTQCCFASVFGLLFAIVAIFILVKILQIQ